MTRMTYDAAVSFARDKAAMAMTEFGLVLPILIILGCSGLEIANFVITKMRISQVALQLADNASRMGDAVQGIKTVSESNISEVFTGGNLQASTLNLRTKGRVILSSLEPMTNPNSTTDPRYTIRWQRCYGTQSHASGHGVQGATNLTGIGAANRKVTAQDYEATMFVEVFYAYTPLFTPLFAPAASITEIAAMAVRDPRTLGVQPTSTGTSATC